VAKVKTEPAVRNVLLDAMLSAIKMINGMIYALRQEYNKQGKAGSPNRTKTKS
jgi:hypothetical protein